MTIEKIDDEERRERIQKRCTDHASSAWWSFNQHFKAANFNKFLGYGLSIIITILGGVLSYGLIWDTVPNWAMISLAVSVSVLSGIQLVISPSDKRDRLTNSAHEYQSLFDDVVDFVELDLPREDQTMPEIEEEYNEIRKRRKELNMETPDVSSFWYLYVKRQKGADGMKEAFSDETEKELFER